MPAEFFETSSPLWLEQNDTTVHRGARDWLFDEGSLTRRLTDLAGGRFAIQVLEEGFEVLRADECEALELPAGSTGWAREVLLCGVDTPWVFARTVTARQAAEATDLELPALGNRSLGDLLFDNSAFLRGPIEICQYPSQWLPETHQVEGLWARRSRFDRDETHLLVAEVFLTGFWGALMFPPAKP
ncbi:chorismate lyase [Pseudomonas sp. dw_358]|uniref:chorismate--pyruvate lyase family protein n=1 Tax=Pseudomonas sp. dw_358 TaxID=2720083 RepID=UPI001BD2EE2B